MEKKITKREMYTKILVEVADNQEMVDFINHEIDLLNRKNTAKSGKPTATQQKNEEIKAKILATMDYEQQYTVSDLVKLIPNEETGDLYSTPKMSALVRQLKEQGAVIREEIKGRAYFTKVA